MALRFKQKPDGSWEGYRADETNTATPSPQQETQEPPLFAEPPPQEQSSLEEPPSPQATRTTKKDK